MTTRTASIQHRESVRSGTPSAALDADEAYALDPVRHDDGETTHGSLVDIVSRSTQMLRWISTFRDTTENDRPRGVSPGLASPLKSHRCGRVLPERLCARAPLLEGAGRPGVDRTRSTLLRPKLPWRAYATAAPPVRRQTLPEALEYTWQGYPIR
jgi:hypothetical protein